MREKLRYDGGGGRIGIDEGNRTEYGGGGVKGEIKTQSQKHLNELSTGAREQNREQICRRVHDKSTINRSDLC